MLKLLLSILPEWLHEVAANIRGQYMIKKLPWRRTLSVLGIGVLAAGLLSLAGPKPSSAHERGDWNNETRYFLKVSGLTGSSTDSLHKGEIELNSYRIMEDEPDAPNDNGMQTQLAKLGDNNLRFLADSSKASPLLFAKAQTGETLPDATLTVIKGGKHSNYMTIKMTDVVVTSYQNSGNDSNNAIDEVLMNYGTVQIEHNEGTPVKEGWDFRKKAEL